MAQDKSQDKPWFDYEEFASMTGFHTGMSQLDRLGEVKWTNTATDMRAGGIHGLRYKAEKDDLGNLTLMLQHWVHWPGGKVPVEEEKKRNPHILTFRTETRKTEDGRTQIRPVDVVWMGKTYTDPADIMKFMHLLQETSAEIRDNIAKNTEHQTPYDPGAFPRLQRRVRQTKRRDEIPNLYNLAQRCDLKPQFSLEGMYFNGEFNFGEEVKASEPPAYPLQLLRAMLALEAEITQSEGKPFSRSHTMPNPQAGGFDGVTYNVVPDEEGGRYEGSCRVWGTNAKGERAETTLYRVSFRRQGEEGNMYRLESLEMLGNKPDLTDHKGVARAIRAMKYIHLAMQRGEAPMFSDILHEHDLKAFLRRPEQPVSRPESPRTLLQVFGANMDAVFSQKEKSIGSNGLVIIRDFMKNGKWVKQGIGVDWGVTFGDPKRDYYNTIAHNYGRFTTHPAAPYIKPYVETIIGLETHEHEDHLRGVARLAKFGFNLPPLVMNAHTRAVLRRMMTEERVSKKKIDAIMKRCHVVDVHKDVNPGNPAETKTFEYGDTVITQGTEEIWSESEQRKKFFPVLTIQTKQDPEAKTRVRIGPAGHSAHALMFEVEGVLYTGDYKLDQTVPADLRSDLDWLAACKDAAVHVQECTNAAKDVPFNPAIAEVKDNRKKILREERKNRVFYDTIGSNAIDIEMLVRAAGEVRQEYAGTEENPPPEKPPYKYVLFAGTAIRNKYRDLNETHDFKRKMKAEYGIETLTVDSKTAKALLAGELDESFIVVMTGTQDEPLSLTHRVSRDLHDTIRLKAGDVVIRGQAPIPGDNRAALRREQNNRYRHDFGCRVYDAVELAESGFHIYTSSHASQDDYKQVHELTGNLLKVLHHGGPQQLTKMKERLEKLGAQTVIPDKQAVYEIDRANKTMRVAGETPEERVGYREIRDDFDEFYKKHRQQATVNRVKDRWHGDVAAQMYKFEALADKRENERHSAAPTNRGVNISDDFNELASDGDFPPIGILHPEIQRPYYENHKNIKLFIGMDTETTGVNPALDVHTDASFVAATPDGKIVGEKTLRHALPRYMMPSAGALGVTKNDNPARLYTGLPLREYAYRLREAYREWPQQLMDAGKSAEQLADEKSAKTDKARAVFFGYRNGVFDDPITMRMMGMALAAGDMKPMATNGNIQLDVYNLFTAMIALMPDKLALEKDRNGNYVRTLQAACKAAGVEYDTEKAHGSLYDSHCTMRLLMKLREMSPDVFEQMLMNCDFSASRSSPMIDQILGQNLHLNDQAPIFGYVDMRDRKCQPRLGALVTIDTRVSKATDAIVMDLSKADVHQLEQLPDYKLLELMNDPEGPFAVVKMNNSPCWFPAQFVWNDSKTRARAIEKLPKHTLMHRANALKQMRSNGQDVGNNFIQRVQRLYPQSDLCRIPRDERHASRAPANNNSPAKSFRLPNERVFSLFHILKPVNQIKNRHYKAAARLLREIQPAAIEFDKKADKQKPETFWKGALKRIHKISEETGGNDPHIEDLRFLIEWLVDDMDSEWLPKKDRIRVNALKSAMLHGPDDAYTMTIERFLREVEDMESNTALFNKIAGDGVDAQARWQALKQSYVGHAESMARSKKFAMTEDKREKVREYRRQSPDSAAPRARLD